MKSVIYKNAIDLTEFSDKVIILDRLTVYHSNLSNTYIVKSPYLRQKDAYINSLNKMLEYVLLNNHQVICTKWYCEDHSATINLDINLGVVILHYILLNDASVYEDCISILRNISSYSMSLGITLINSRGIVYTLYVVNKITKFKMEFTCFNYKSNFILNRDVDRYFKEHKRHCSALSDKSEVIYSLAPSNENYKDYIDFILNNSKSLCLYNVN